MHWLAVSNDATCMRCSILYCTLVYTKILLETATKSNYRVNIHVWWVNFSLYNSLLQETKVMIKGADGAWSVCCLKIEEVISSQSYNAYSSFRPVCSLAADPVY